MAVKMCSECGEYNSYNSMVCVSCGNSLSNATILNESDDSAFNKNNYVICSKCNSKLEVNTRNCPYCGEFLAKGSKAVNHYYVDSTKQKETNNFFLYIASLIIPLVGFVAGAVLLANDEDYKKESGKVCIIIGIISTLLGGIIIMLM